MTPGVFQLQGMPARLSGTGSTALTLALAAGIFSLSGQAMAFTQGGPSADLVMYSGATGVLDQSKWPAGNNYSYGGTMNYQSIAQVQAGHTYSLQCVPGSSSGMGWQQATNWATVPPNGVDTSPYTYLQFDIWTSSPSLIKVLFHYTRSTGDDLQTSCVVDNVNFIPGVSLVANTWCTVKIPMSALGNLSSYNYYKFLIQQSSAGAFYLDNVKFVAGNTGWIYRGNPNLEAGWADSNTNATLNYAFLPQTLSPGTSGLFSINNPPKPASVFHGSITGTTLTVSSVVSGSVTVGEILMWANNAAPADLTITGGTGPTYTLSASTSSASQLMGSAPPQSSICCARVTTTAANGQWKMTYAGGYSITPYTTFTFAVIPTKTSYNYYVQFYSTSGLQLGGAVLAGAYTPEDQGVQVQNFTIYNMPLTAFGSLGATIGGVSITDASTNTTNVFYPDQVGFYS